MEWLTGRERDVERCGECVSVEFYGGVREECGSEGGGVGRNHCCEAERVRRNFRWEAVGVGLRRVEFLKGWVEEGGILGGGAEGGRIEVQKEEEEEEGKLPCE